MVTSKTSSSKRAGKNKATAAGEKSTANKKTASKKAVSKKVASKKPASKKAASKTTVSKKAASKKVAGKATVSKKTASKKTASKKTSVASARRKPQGKPASLKRPSEVEITREAGRYFLPSHVEVELGANYHPGKDTEYMGPRQLAYFRAMLRDWRDKLVEESRQTMDNLAGEVRDVGDDAERATRETENSLELRTRDRYRKLIGKIDKALRRIEDGTYGYCEETDEEIGVPRLDARPIATLSLDAQERREHLRKQMGD